MFKQPQRDPAPVFVQCHGRLFHKSSTSSYSAVAGKTIIVEPGAIMLGTVPTENEARMLYIIPVGLLRQLSFRLERYTLFVI
jgi:hypothetical protein